MNSSLLFPNCSEERNNVCKMLKLKSNLKFFPCNRNGEYNRWDIMNWKKYLVYYPINKCTWKNNRYTLFPEDILSMQSEMSYIIVYDPKFIFQDLVLGTKSPSLFSYLCQKMKITRLCIVSLLIMNLFACGFSHCNAKGMVQTSITENTECGPWGFVEHWSNNVHGSPYFSGCVFVNILQLLLFYF